MASTLILLAAAMSSTTADPAVRRFELANKMAVVLEVDRREPVVAVTVMYRAGSADDPPSRHGLAHLVEHLTFRQTKHQSMLEAWSLLERAGAREINATTAPDYTEYHAIVPQGALARTLWAEADRMAFVLEAMTDEIFAAEHPVVIREMTLRRGSRSARFDALFNRAFYPSEHPYRDPPDELAETRALTAHDARWFFQQHYRPDLAAIALVGDFDLDDTEAEVRRYFETIVPPAAAPPVPPEVPAMPSRCRQIEVSARVGLPRLRIRWALEPNADHQALRVIATYLRRRLSDQLGHRFGASIDVGAWVQLGRYGTTFDLAVIGARAVDPAALASLVFDELRKLRTGSIGAGPLRRAVKSNRSPDAASERSSVRRAIDHAKRALGLPDITWTEFDPVRAQRAANNDLIPAKRTVALLRAQGETLDVTRSIGTDCR